MSKKYTIAKIIAVVLASLVAGSMPGCGGGSDSGGGGGGGGGGGQPVCDIYNPGLDCDLDGMLNGWELQYGLNPSYPIDALLDLDNDGLSNLREFQNNTIPNQPDTDSDGRLDGEELTPDHCGKTTDPLDPDSDGDNVNDGADQMPMNPNASIDNDQDCYGPDDTRPAMVDCDDNDKNNWTSCAACVDIDTDTWFVGCDAYATINGPDCSDADIDNWLTCAATDFDGDNAFVGCDAYTTRNGPDCDDANKRIYPGGARGLRPERQPVPGRRRVRECGRGTDLALPGRRV